MSRSMWMSAAGWATLVAAALALAWATPAGRAVLGRLPSVAATKLVRQPVSLPQGLPSERTIALLSFKRGQGAMLDDWVRTLELDIRPQTDWVRLAIVDDPAARDRKTVENRLMTRYPAEADRARVVPVFTNRAAFLTALGLDSPHEPAVVVVNREGDVLARVSGLADADKRAIIEQALRAPEH